MDHVGMSGDAKSLLEVLCAEKAALLSSFALSFATPTLRHFVKTGLISCENFPKNLADAIASLPAQGVDYNHIVAHYKEDTIHPMEATPFVFERGQDLPNRITRQIAAQRRAPLCRAGEAFKAAGTQPVYPRWS